MKARGHRVGGVGADRDDFLDVSVVCVGGFPGGVAGEVADLYEGHLADRTPALEGAGAAFGRAPGADVLVVVPQDLDRPEFEGVLELERQCRVREAVAQDDVAAVEG